MDNIIQTVDGNWSYYGDTFEIIMTRYSDPQRLNLARNAARYLGKDDIENVRRPLSILRQGHVGEVFRGEMVEFEFVDVSKEVYDHLVTYTTRNMRVAGGNRALVSDDFTMPSDKVKFPDYVEEKINGSMSNYKSLLEQGETPQVARSAMPVAAKMNTFVYQFNFLTLGESVFKQRIWEKGAQGNTAKVIKGMFALCENMDKELWDAFYEAKGTPALEWVQVKKKLKKSNFTIHDMLNELHKMCLEGEGDPKMNVVDYLVKRFGEQKSMWD